MLATVVAVNARLSWRPVFVDFGQRGSATDSPAYLPVAWRGDRLWLLKYPSSFSLSLGTNPPCIWRITRNWNRVPLPLVCGTSGLGDVMALNAATREFAQTRGLGADTRIQIQRDNTFSRFLEDKGHRNRYNLMRPRAATLFSFSPDGTHLIANSQLYGLSDATEVKNGFCAYGAVLFDVRSGQQIRRQSAVEGCFTDFAWSPDSREVAGITADGWVFILDGASGQLRLKFRAHQYFGAQVAWAPDGKTLLTATNSRLGWSPTHLAFDFKSGVGFMGGGSFIMRGDKGRAGIAIVQHSNGELTFNGHTERLLKRFDSQTGKQRGKSVPLQTGAVDMVFSPDGRQVALGEHNFALILDADTLATKRRLPTSVPAPTNSPPDPVCVAWSPDGGTLATSTWRGITLWRTR